MRVCGVSTGWGGCLAWYLTARPYPGHQRTPSPGSASSGSEAESARKRNRRRERLTGAASPSRWDRDGSPAAEGGMDVCLALDPVLGGVHKQYCKWRDLAGMVGRVNNRISETLSIRWMRVSVVHPSVADYTGSGED